jgi:hypothetical protein
LTANVHGTVTDSSGNVYRVNGHFADRGIHTLLLFDLIFNGEGHLVITGPAGRYVGKAVGRAVMGPPERLLAFTEMSVCSM